MAVEPASVIWWPWPIAMRSSRDTALFFDGNVPLVCHGGVLTVLRGLPAADVARSVPMGRGVLAWTGKSERVTAYSLDGSQLSPAGGFTAAGLQGVSVWDDKVLVTANYDDGSLLGGTRFHVRLGGDFAVGPSRELTGLVDSTPCAAGFIAQSRKDWLALYDWNLNEVWRRDLNTEKSQKQIPGTTRVFVDDLVINNDGSEIGMLNGELAAYALADGSEVWRRHFPGEVSIWEREGLLYCAGAGSMWVLDAKTGAASIEHVRAVEKGNAQDSLWCDGKYLWYGSVLENKIHIFSLDGNTRLRTLPLPNPFALLSGRSPGFTEGWAYLPVSTADIALNSSVNGLLRIGPLGDELPNEIQPQDRPPHRIYTFADGKGEAYRIAMKASNLDELLVFQRILVKTEAIIRGVHTWQDERRNPRFTGRVVFATDLEALGESEQQEVFSTGEAIERELSRVLSGDQRQRIRVEVVQLDPGEVESSDLEVNSPQLVGAAPALHSHRSEQGDLPEVAVEALNDAVDDPLLRLGFAVVLLGGGALGDDFPKRRGRADVFLQRAYMASTGFPQSLAFHTGLLLTTPGMVDRLWGSKAMAPKQLWPDITQGLMQLAHRVNDRKVSVDEALKTLTLLRGMLGQLASESGKIDKLPKPAKKVFDGIEKAFSEMEKQLRRQS